MFLLTPRLLLRPLWREDAAQIAAAISWDVARMTARMPWPYELEQARQFVALPIFPGAPVETGRAAITCRTSGALLGCVGFGRNAVNDALEIGYWLAEAAWGQGYATEASRAWVGFGFNAIGLPELYAGHFIDNPRSGAVLRKLGFRPTGEVQDYPCAPRGCTVPAPLFHLTRADWQATNR